MSDDGIRNINALKSGETRAEVQIAVFVDAEKVLIEQTDAVEHRAEKEDTAAGGAEDFSGIEENTLGLVPVAALVGNSRDGHAVTGAVECAGSEDDARGGKADARVALSRLVEALKPIGFGGSIIINEGDPFAAGF